MSPAISGFYSFIFNPAFPLERVAGAAAPWLEVHHGQQQSPGFSMGVGFLWESHRKRSMGWDRHKLLWDGDGDGTDKYVPWTTLGLSMGMSFLWESHMKRPMGWDGTGINCYGMGMGQINMSNGQPWQSQISHAYWLNLEGLLNQEQRKRANSRTK